MSGKKGMKHYSEAIKEKAARMHREEGITYREIMKQLGIVSKRRLEEWCKAYQEKGILGLRTKSKGRSRKTERTEQEQLEYELKQLRMENELLRNFLYEVGRK